MTNDITITLPKEDWIGLYYLAQLGIISAALNAHIESVKLKDTDQAFINEYNAMYNDYQKTVLDARSVGRDNQSSLELAFAALDGIRDTINSSPDESE